MVSSKQGAYIKNDGSLRNKEAKARVWIRLKSWGCDVAIVVDVVLACWYLLR